MYCLSLEWPSSVFVCVCSMAEDFFCPVIFDGRLNTFTFPSSRSPWNFQYAWVCVVVNGKRRRRWTRKYFAPIMVFWLKGQRIQHDFSLSLSLLQLLIDIVFRTERRGWRTGRMKKKFSHGEYNFNIVRVCMRGWRVYSKRSQKVSRKRGDAKLRKDLSIWCVLTLSKLSIH